jgi:outer membrane protein insertion porin family
MYEYGGEPLGGEVDFHRIESTLDLFFPIYVHEENQLHHVIGLFSKAGVIEGHHTTESIPIFERFFLGGPNTVRGFEFRGLGPHFNNDSQGGAAEWYGNVEYVFPLFQKFLRGVVFLDYGNLATDFNNFTLDETRLAAGGGIRVNFPFLGGQPLPIGLYLGHAFRKEDSDRTRLFLFTIGVPF